MFKKNTTSLCGESYKPNEIACDVNMPSSRQGQPNNWRVGLALRVLGFLLDSRVRQRINFLRGSNAFNNAKLSGGQ